MPDETPLTDSQKLDAILVSTRNTEETMRNIEALVKRVADEAGPMLEKLGNMPGLKTAMKLLGG